MKILVTGAAGFIGFHLAKRFLERGDEIVGVDNLNDYYDVSLKEMRLGQLAADEKFRFVKLDIADIDAMEKLFGENDFDRVIHMAAQAGVRYSLEHPHVYAQSNLVGFLNVLECCRNEIEKRRTNGEGRKNASQQLPIADHDRGFHLLYASSSSVYGLNKKIPFSVNDNVDHPISLYAATKKSNELMAHTYSHLYGIPATGLRFFTVYGPWGRPDMAYFKFTRAIADGETIEVYNEGNMERDFTYIDDVVEGVVRVSDRVPGSESSSAAPYKIYNIGNNSPVKLMDFIATIEKALGKKANMKFLPMQPGDMLATYADVDDLMRDVGFSPSTSSEDGIGRFVEWYRKYYS